MKKLLAFLLVVACIATTASFKIQTSPIFSIPGIWKVCFVNDASFDFDGVESVKSGNVYFNFCSLDTAKENLKTFQKDCHGIQLYVSDMTFEQLLDRLKADVVSQSTHSEMQIYNCFTPFFDDAVFEDGKKVNLQVAVKGEEIVAGFPVILTGC